MIDSALAPVQETLPAQVSERFRELVPLVNRGDEDAARELHKLCMEEPGLWEALGSLESSSIESWVRVIAPGSSQQDAFSRSQIRQELRRLRQDLREDGASPLERLLIGQIQSAWLMQQQADAKYAQALHCGCSPEEDRFHQRRVTLAQRHLLQAIRALATTRRLLHPVQVNFAHQQIVVGG